MTRAEHERLQDRLRQVWRGDYRAEPEPIDLMIAATEYRRCRMLMRDRLKAIETR